MNETEHFKTSEKQTKNDKSWLTAIDLFLVLKRS